MRIFYLLIPLLFVIDLNAGATRARWRTIEMQNVRPYEEGTNEGLLRLSWPDYGDNEGWELREGPNPRQISNAVAAQGERSIPSKRRLSDAIWAWGQFLDHDISLTESSPDNGMANIPILDTDDKMPGPLSFARSHYELDGDGMRQQINQITPFIDASNVYGSDPIRAAALRSFEGGRLLLDEDGLLPLNHHGLENAGGHNPLLFLAGDVRANENVVLTSLHTLFVREHNRLATRIARVSPQASDEQIYQLARRLVAAQMQIITYTEFLPALLGPYAPGLNRPRGYDPSLSPQIANEFSTALFRLGHSMLSSDISVGKHESIKLRDAFFNPLYLQEDPSRIDALLTGLSAKRSQEIDTRIVDDVRNFLFAGPAGGLDLAALNIQRGRDHGLPPYVALRQAYGLSVPENFEDISSDPEILAQLRSVYASVAEIDAWVGALAEDHVPGTSVGPLCLAGLVDQFTRLRDADPLYFLGDHLLHDRLARKVIRLERVSLARIIRWNTDAKVPRKIFYARGKPRRK